MKYYIYTVLLLLLTASCSDDVQKWDQWPEWKLASPLSVGGQVLDEEIYSNFQGKKHTIISRLSFETGLIFGHIFKVIR